MWPHITSSHIFLSITLKEDTDIFIFKGINMKATAVIASTMFAVTSAFAPASRVAFNTGTRAFSRSAELFANPK